MTFFNDPLNTFTLASIVFFLWAVLAGYLHWIVLLPQYKRIEKFLFEYVPSFMEDKNVPIAQKQRLSGILSHITDIVCALNSHSRRIAWTTLLYLGIQLMCCLYFNKHSFGMLTDTILIYLQLAIIPSMLLYEIIETVKLYNIATYIFTSCERWFNYAKRITILLNKGEEYLLTVEGYAEIIQLEKDLERDVAKYIIK